ncbi:MULTISPECIES: OsmC family protein [unclassified Streptomyces]|uniref:OsmC family protein n=1 Tax=unclassified Streptomyces TaxID=2593676 RepID=UPI0037F85348
MTSHLLRSVTIERTGAGQFTATNVRGATVDFGTGSGADFTPVELFLAAIGGCTAADVDVATSRHAEPATFRVTVTGNKAEDEHGSRSCFSGSFSSNSMFLIPLAWSSAASLRNRQIKSQHIETLKIGGLNPVKRVLREA